MPTRFLLIPTIALFLASSGCGSGDKHLPSSNPPEYDPKKVYTTPVLPLVSSPQGARVFDDPLAAGTGVPDPCEKQPKKPQKPDEPPIVCGEGAGRDEKPIVGGEGGGGSSSGGGGGGGRDGRESADTTAKRASYLLEFQSRIVDNEITAPALSVAAGKVMLTLVEGKDMYRGSGTIGYQTGPPPNRDPCSSLIMGHGTTRFDVAGLFIKMVEGTGAGGGQTGSANIELHYLINPTNETERPVAYPEGQCAPGKPVAYPFFYAMYAVSRGAVEINLLKDWTYVGQDSVVASKVLRGNCGDFCEDVTVFTLKEAEGAEEKPHVQ